MEKNNIKSYKDLLIWQKGIEICKMIYKIVSEYPPDEKFALVSQMKRCSISIPSNIAEGYGRKYTNGYAHFLSIARGSLMELETQIILSKEFNFITQNNFDILMKLIEEESKMLTAFIKSIQSYSNRSKSTNA